MQNVHKAYTEKFENDISDHRELEAKKFKYETGGSSGPARVPSSLHLYLSQFDLKTKWTFSTAGVQHPLSLVDSCSSKCSWRKQVQRRRGQRRGHVPDNVEPSSTIALGGTTII